MKNIPHKLLLLTILLLTGCAANKGTINSFYEPSYQQGTVASLAVTGIRNARLAPSESQQIGRNVNMVIAQENPNLKLVSANVFNNLLNDKSMVGDYADFIKDYITSGIANRDFLSVLKSNGLDAIMISELSRVSQKDAQYGLSKGETRVTLSFTIMDTRTNDVIWSASADGIKGTATTMGSAPPLLDAINLAVEKIKESVPTL